jgi:hypothetical protein
MTNSQIDRLLIALVLDEEHAGSLYDLFNESVGHLNRIADSLECIAEYSETRNTLLVKYCENPSA